MPRVKSIAWAVLIAAGVFLGSFSLAAATSTFITQQGGTGTTSPSGILYGDNGATGHLNTVSIGSNLNFSGGILSATGGSSGLSTTSPLSSSNLLVYSASGAGSAYGVATSTLSVGTTLSVSGTLGALVSGTSATINLNLANPNTWTGLQTFTNASTTGELTATNFETTLYSDNFTGSDMGAKINAAYAALPSTGGTIVVPAGAYSFSTPIVFGTNLKPVNLLCSGGGATNLTYIGTATSTTFNTGFTTINAGYGMKNCTLNGPNAGIGGTTIGIQVGGTNGAPNSTFDGLRVNGFGKDFVTGNNTWIVTVSNSIFQNGDRSVDIQGNSNSGENLKFIGDTFADCTTVANCFNVPGSAVASLELTDDAFDDGQLAIADGNTTVTVVGGHFENPNQIQLGRYTFVVNDATGQGNGVLSITGATFYNDATTSAKSPNQFILNGGHLVFGANGVENDHSIPVASVITNIAGSAATIEAYGNNSIGGYSAMATSSLVENIDAQNNLVSFGAPFDGITINASDGNVNNSGYGLWVNSGHNFISSQDNPINQIGNGGDGTQWPLVINNPNSINASSTGLCFSVSSGLNTACGGGFIFQRQGGGSLGDLVFALEDSGDTIRERARITSAGNFGIGSTSPGTLLSIGGAGTGINFGDNATSTFSKGIQASDFCTATKCLSSTGGGGSGIVGTGTTGQFPFYNANSTTLTATSSLFITQAGNVGVGSTSPMSAFSIDNPVGGASLLSIGNGTNILQIGFSSGGAAGAIIQTPSNSSLTFRTNGTQRGVFTGGGKFAVGTTTTTALYNEATVWGQGATTGGTFAVVNSASTTLLQILDNGNVGIGTTSPYSLLSVSGQVAAQNFVATSTTASSTFMAQIYTPFNVTSTPHFDFGDGTDANDWLLTAAGGRGSIWYTTGDAQGNEAFTFAAGSGKGADIDVSCTNNAFKSGCTQAVTVLSDGRVGIATTSPWATLSVVASSGSNPLFVVATSSGQGFPNFEIDGTGHIVTSGGKPIISSCGTTNSISGNDVQGSIMFTGTLVTACTLTFATAVPAGQTLGCTASDNSLTGFSDISATSTTAVTFGISTGLAAGTIYYNCSRWQ